MISIKGIIDKVASRKLAVTAGAGAAAATGAIELTWPMAAVAVAYIVGQTVVDTWGTEGETIGKEKRGYVGQLRRDDRQREAGRQ